jgi:hypothetical protein
VEINITLRQQGMMFNFYKVHSSGTAIRPSTIHSTEEQDAQNNNLVNSAFEGKEGGMTPTVFIFKVQVQVLT